MPDQITIIDPKVHDLGGFQVRRALPHINARHVGPFVFFDHMGPATFARGEGIDVRPHPHIGLATVTYLYDGAIEHRDSLGNILTIRPGDVNWMTAGRGIAHSERSPMAERAAGHALHGIQTWVALPQNAEEADPSFHHHASADLPQMQSGGVRLRLIVGEAFGKRSPVATFSRMFYVAADFTAGSALILPPEHVERAVYAPGTTLQVGEVELAPGKLAVLPRGIDVTIRAATASRALIFGGDPLDGERHLWWNFVSSSRERIEQAKRDWAESRFAPVVGETEFIPLPK
jgi:redox-sensitive bicupin YhaK (pirin superfamily)